MASTLQIPPYRSALLTGADGAPVIRSNGPDSELVMTDRQWYLFWQQLAAALNAGAQTLEGLGNMLTFGNHADRPDPGPWPDGALYVEQDRGSVLYQNQGGVWQYIAGIMYGTLVPDQRPADLGPAADAGFQFRTNVDPAQAFVWSGTAWIETTPIRYGTHAERLAAPIADLVSGMLWMETDRGSVIYQNQGGTWLYLAGTMWDTMSPDHRPTDLGVHDAGFDYRSTDPPPREFIWAQTAWVETTPAAQTPWKQDIDGAGFTLANVGRIGAGTPTPAYRLGLSNNAVALPAGYAGTIAQLGGADGDSTRIVFDSFGNCSNLTFRAAGGTAATPAALASGAPLGVVGFIGRGATAYSGSRALFFANAAEAWTDTAQGTYFTFHTTALGTTGVTERVRIDPAGKVGIGIIPSFQLQLSSDSTGKPLTSTWGVVSDLRLKQNIEPVKEDSLAILGKLEWIRYEYNGQAGMPAGAKGIGLVAQALREQMPEAVRSTRTKLNETDAEESDVLSIDYHYVLVHSARAIQQLSAEVKRLGALIEKPIQR